MHDLLVPAIGRKNEPACLWTADRKIPIPQETDCGHRVKQWSAALSPLLDMSRRGPARIRTGFFCPLITMAVGRATGRAHSAVLLSSMTTSSAPLALVDFMMPVLSSVRCVWSSSSGLRDGNGSPGVLPPTSLRRGQTFSGCSQVDEGGGTQTAHADVAHRRTGALLLLTRCEVPCEVCLPLCRVVGFASGREHGWTRNGRTHMFARMLFLLCCGPYMTTWIRLASTSLISRSRCSRSFAGSAFLLSSFTLTGNACNVLIIPLASCVICELMSTCSAIGTGSTAAKLAAASASARAAPELPEESQTAGLCK